jgi:hypothetical protein
MRKLALDAADFLHTHDHLHAKLMYAVRSIQVALHCHQQT